MRITQPVGNKIWIFKNVWKTKEKQAREKGGEYGRKNTHGDEYQGTLAIEVTELPTL